MGLNKIISFIIIYLAKVIPSNSYSADGTLLTSAAYEKNFFNKFLRKDNLAVIIHYRLPEYNNNFKFKGNEGKVTIKFYSMIQVSDVVILHVNGEDNSCSINQFSVKGWVKDPLRSRGSTYQLGIFSFNNFRTDRSTNITEQTFQLALNDIITGTDHILTLKLYIHNNCE